MQVIECIDLVISTLYISDSVYYAHKFLLGGRYFYLFIREHEELPFIVTIFVLCIVEKNICFTF